MNYEEKIERKRERYEALIVKNQRISNSSIGCCSEERTGIPFGQPILVGHHSERSHRNAIKRMENQMRKGFEASNKAEYYENKLKGLDNSNVISSDDDKAIMKLKEKIEHLEEQRTSIKEHNKKSRKDKTLKPYRSYVLTNLGANIRSTKKRLIKLESLANKENKEHTINDMAVIENYEENRLQVFFDGKPNFNTRTELKRNGFKWSRYNKAWQRHLNNAGRYAVRNVTDEVQ